MKPTLQGGGFVRGYVDGEVLWTKDVGYVGTTGSGKRFDIYGESSPSPMEMVLNGHAACSLIDVIDGLKHRIEKLQSARVEINASRAEDSPRVFTSIQMNYIITGDIPEALIRRLIESSHKKYCSVGIMITRSGASLDWTLQMEK